ncbi:MAG: pgeF [Hydrocarboniphaga sp.]|uniref:peptidoglycan editing factor PgeF n=1 Tax=Hydrocarboniphaga sp. TaxID=2033016 RepID=UPI00260D132C|nr:peptidoglycan editing factor PgeF [Hydrocarboniphaga sp.]MDB5972393.1 pgeF [Hydrocarboniphaga sp.]
MLGGASFLVPDWPAPARVRSAQTTRIGGAGQGVYAGFNLATHVGDDAQRVAANRAELRRALSLPAEPRWLEQVHGVRARQLPSATCNATDAAWTASPGEVCVVMSADCLPVLFCDEAGSCVATAHAGWRGLADGVLEATIAAMPAAPSRLMAWLGPAIGPQAFEIGAEVRARFVADDASAAQYFVAAADAGKDAGKYWADLYGLARARLRKAGLQNIHGGGFCTYTDADRFFSFRRDRVCGRMASLIWLQP